MKVKKQKYNPYKEFGDYLSELAKDHIEGDVLEDQILEQKHEQEADAEPEEIDTEDKGVETLNESITK